MSRLQSVHVVKVCQSSQLRILTVLCNIVCFERVPDFLMTTVLQSQCNDVNDNDSCEMYAMNYCITENRSQNGLSCFCCWPKTNTMNRRQRVTDCFLALGPKRREPAVQQKHWAKGGHYFTFTRKKCWNCNTGNHFLLFLFRVESGFLWGMSQPYSCTCFVHTPVKSDYV